MRRMVPVAMMRSFTVEQAIFGPATLEVWDSETAMATDAGGITGWTGMVRGLPFVPSGTVQPTYQTGGLNGHRFASFAYHQDNPLSVALGTTLNQPLTLLMVFTWVDFDFSAGIIGGASGEVSFQISSGNIRLIAGSVGIDCNGAGWAGGASHMLALRCDGPNNIAQCYRSGTLLGSGNPVGNHVLSVLNLAGFIGPASSNQLHVYHVGAITKYATDGELNSWWAQMSPRYNLPFTPIP